MTCELCLEPAPGSLLAGLLICGFCELELVPASFFDYAPTPTQEPPSFNGTPK